LYFQGCNSVSTGTSKLEDLELKLELEEPEEDRERVDDVSEEDRRDWLGSLNLGSAPLEESVVGAMYL
jgi:hypothetical protein